ncbi:MAG: nucleoside 2-deoxyribosyltransferase [Candidatus Eisenbacteria bacterium]
MDRFRIYFAGAIRGGRGDRGLYRGLIDHLRSRGEVLTEHVGDPSLSEDGEEGLSDRAIYDRDVGWIVGASVVIAEVTTPSLGVGYEIATAESHRKPTLCLFRPSAGVRLSAMIEGSHRSVVRPYETLEEAVAAVDEFLASVLPR